MEINVRTKTQIILNIFKHLKHQIMKKLILMSAFVVSLVFAGFAQTQTPTTKKETTTTTTKKEVTTPGKKMDAKKMDAKKMHAKKVETKKVETTTTTKPATPAAPAKK